MRKRKSEEETNRNIRSLSERLKVRNELLSPILTSLETKATTENSNDTEETVEADFLEELHTRGT